MRSICFIAAAGLLLAACQTNDPGPATVTQDEPVAGAEAAPVAPPARAGLAKRAEPAKKAEPERPVTRGVPPSPEVVAAIKTKAATTFKDDPASARWQDMKQAMRPNGRGQPTEVVCGRVNAKPFIYFVKHRALYVPSGGDKLMDEVALTVIKDFCTGLLSEV